MNPTSVVSMIQRLCTLASFYLTIFVFVALPLLSGYFEELAGSLVVAKSKTGNIQIVSKIVKNSAIIHRLHCLFQKMQFDITYIHDHIPKSEKIFAGNPKMH